MPGNQGGRATQDPDEILDRHRDGAARDKAAPVSAPPGSAQADRNAAIAFQAAERLHDEAAQVEAAEAGAEISSALINPESLAQLGRASGSFWGVAPPVVGSSDPFVLEALRMIMKLDVDTGAIQ